MPAGGEKIVISENTEFYDQVIRQMFQLCKGDPTDYSKEEIQKLSIFDDLKFDSILLVDLLISLEEIYGISLTDDMSGLLEHMDRIETFVEYIGEKVQNA